MCPARASLHLGAVYMPGTSDVEVCLSTWADEAGGRLLEGFRTEGAVHLSFYPKHGSAIQGKVQYSFEVGTNI